MRRVAVIQARMGSTRLPGKVLLPLAGRPLLAQEVARLRQCPVLDAIGVATSALAADDAIAALCRELDVPCFRGSERDVLSRYVGAARAMQADVVVRVTADCPLIDPDVTARVVGELTGHAADCDYASNVLERTYPRGLDAEAFFADVLLRADRLAQCPAAREHVTVVIRSERRELFLCRSVTDAENHSDLRWTVDTERDLQLVRRLYDELGLAERRVPYAEIVGHVRRHPELAALNAMEETWDPRTAAPC